MTLPNPLLALNSTFYNTRMRCYAAWGVLCESEVKMPIWMYIGASYKKIEILNVDDIQIDKMNDIIFTLNGLFAII